MFGFGSYNRIEIIGRLGKDPELNVTPDGKPVTKFSIAQDEYQGKDASGESKKKTNWFNVVSWQTLAEMAERFIVKGNLVYIAGRLSMRDYTDKQGVKRQAIEVIAETIQLLEKSNRQTSEQTPTGSSDPFLPDFPEDLP